MNIEKYYGVTIKLTEELEPERLDQLIQVAPQFLSLHGYDPDDYYLYCHQTLIKPFTPHWAEDMAIEDRIKSMRIIFTVNQKQLPTDHKEARIMFYNWRWPREDSIEKILGFSTGGHVARYLQKYEMDYVLDNDFIKTSNCFKNAILTVIDKTLRLNHRKIKAHVTAEPTDKFRNKLHDPTNADRETALDYYLETPIMLKPRLNHGGAEGIHCPLKVFISYSHQDEKMRKKLGQHLAPLVSDGLINIWQDREIEAGADWEGEINKEIREADIILLLVSASFLGSSYCQKELLQALNQRKVHKTPIIPIILRDCDWTDVFNKPNLKIQALPRDDSAVAGKRWKTQDAAFAVIAKELRIKFKGIRN